MVDSVGKLITGLDHGVSYHGIKAKFIVDDCNNPVS